MSHDVRQTLKRPDVCCQAHVHLLHAEPRVFRAESYVDCGDEVDGAADARAVYCRDDGAPQPLKRRECVLHFHDVTAQRFSLPRTVDVASRRAFLAECLQVFDVDSCAEVFSLSCNEHTPDVWVVLQHIVEYARKVFPDRCVHRVSPRWSCEPNFSDAAVFIHDEQESVADMLRSLRRRGSG